jgi:beta-glucanase (GH16 family)
MNAVRSLALGFIALGAGSAISVAAQPTAAPANGASVGHEGWKLVWSDEFNESAIDRSAWTFDLGGGGWGNGESEAYTDRPENARIEDGCLVIEARREKYMGFYYTSARLKTMGLKNFGYGRVEARMKVPAGKGLWPAFWMLGSDFPQTSWPACGEIDIVECIGRDPDIVYGTAHGSGYSGSMGPQGRLRLIADTSQDFHVFAIERDDDRIRWFCDGVQYFTLSRGDQGANAWAFDKDFFIILNLAVGGHWPGPVALDTAFPAKLLVDYVRVYEKTE